MSHHGPLACVHCLVPEDPEPVIGHSILPRTNPLPTPKRCLPCPVPHTGLPRPGSCPQSRWPLSSRSARPSSWPYCRLAHCSPTDRCVPWCRVQLSPIQPLSVAAPQPRNSRLVHCASPRPRQAGWVHWLAGHWRTWMPCILRRRHTFGTGHWSLRFDLSKNLSGRRCAAVSRLDLPPGLHWWHPWRSCPPAPGPSPSHPLHES